MSKSRIGLCLGIAVWLTVAGCNCDIASLLAQPTTTAQPVLNPTACASVLITVSPASLNVGDSLTLTGQAVCFNSEQYAIALSSGGNILTNFENQTSIQHTDSVFDITSVTGHNNTVQVVLKARQAGTATVVIAVRGETTGYVKGTPYFDFTSASSDTVTITVGS